MVLSGLTRRRDNRGHPPRFGQDSGIPWSAIDQHNTGRRSPRRLAIDPPACQSYLLSHRSPATATNGANSDISTLAYRRFEAMTISARGPIPTGGAAEENHAEVGFGPFGGIWLEVRPDVDDEGGAHCREQTSQGTWSGLYIGEGNAETHKNQGGVRSSLCFAMYSVSYSVVSRLYVEWKSSLGSSFFIDWKY